MQLVVRQFAQVFRQNISCSTDKTLATPQLGLHGNTYLCQSRFATEACHVAHGQQLHAGEPSQVGKSRSTAAEPDGVEPAAASLPQVESSAGVEFDQHSMPSMHRQGTAEGSTIAKAVEEVASNMQPKTVMASLAVADSTPEPGMGCTIKPSINVYRRLYRQGSKAVIFSSERRLIAAQLVIDVCACCHALSH